MKFGDLLVTGTCKFYHVGYARPALQISVNNEIVLFLKISEHHGYYTVLSAKRGLVDVSQFNVTYL